MADTYTLDDKGQKVVWSGAVTEDHSTQKETVGAVRYHGTKVYKYVHFTQGATAVASGDFAGYLKERRDSVTADASTTDIVPAGMFISTPADGNFCWIQVRGPATCTVANLSSVADGKNCMLDASNDKKVIAQTAGKRALCQSIDTSAGLIYIDAHI